MKKKTRKTASKRIQNPIRVGNAVHIRTVTHYYTGRIVLLSATEIVLEKSAWIAWPNEEFGDILRNGKVSDFQAIPHPCAISRGALVDVIDWPHALPGHP